MVCHDVIYEKSTKIKQHIIMHRVWKKHECIIQESETRHTRRDFKKAPFFMVKRTMKVGIFKQYQTIPKVISIDARHINFNIGDNLYNLDFTGNSASSAELYFYSQQLCYKFNILKPKKYLAVDTLRISILLADNKVCFLYYIL